MLVKMETSVVEDFAALDEGKFYDLPPARARRLIDLGKATVITATSLSGGRSAKTGAMAKAE